LKAKPYYNFHLDPFHSHVGQNYLSSLQVPQVPELPEGLQLSEILELVGAGEEQSVEEEKAAVCFFYSYSFYSVKPYGKARLFMKKNKAKLNVEIRLNRIKVEKRRKEDIGGEGKKKLGNDFKTSSENKGQAIIKKFDDGGLQKKVKISKQGGQFINRIPKIKPKA